MQRKLKKIDTGWVGDLFWVLEGKNPTVILRFSEGKFSTTKKGN